MPQSTTWKCDVCGYIHHGDAPPDVCPVCGVGPDLFSPFEVAPTKQAPSAARAWRCTICDHVHGQVDRPESCSVCGAGRGLFEPVEERGSAPTEHGLTGSILILGGGIAGITAAQQARLTAPGAEITLITKEPHLPYYRINLTRFLAGEVDEQSLLLQPETWFSEQRIRLLQAEATAMDRQGKRVELQDGRNLGYDRLILAAGAHAFVPPIPGVKRSGVYTLRSLDDARSVLERARSGSRCVCIGGGLLGLETAGALSRRGVRTTVLESFGWLLPRQLAEPAGELLQERLERQGIQVLCDAKVTGILGDEAVEGVGLADDQGIAADLVVLSTGIRPNSHLARQGGLEVNNGVIVDDRMFSSDPDILAAGDVAEHRGVLYGLWPAAYAQGVVAGINAAGGEAEFPGLPPSSRLKVLDVDLLSIGQFQADDGSYQVFEHSADETYTRLVCRDGRLVGANLLGDTSLSSTVKRAIEEGLQLEELTDLPQLVERFPLLLQACRCTDRSEKGG